MGSRPLRRSWTLAGVGAIAVALLAPADAAAVRAFKLGVPKAGEISVARVELRVKARAPGTTPVVRGLRVANARRLPRNVFVAARLSRVGRTNRYIARAVILRRLRKGGSARVAQDLGRRTTLFDLIADGTVRLFDSVSDTNVITDPDVPEICFGPQSDDEWSNLTPLVHVGLVPSNDLDELSQAARDYLCARPVPRRFAAGYDTLDPEPFFVGAHRSFQGNRFEHVFRVHGNEDMGGFSIEPPAGGEFVACGGNDAPCLLESGRVLVPGPFQAGTDVDVNARANVEIPRLLTGESFPGDRDGVFNGTPRPIRIGVRLRF